MLLGGENHLGFALVAEKFLDFSQCGFDFLAIGGSDFVLPAGVFHVHGVVLLGPGSATF
jgi:hypothetical protein